MKFIINAKELKNNKNTKVTATLVVDHYQINFQLQIRRYCKGTILCAVSISDAVLFCIHLF